MDKTYVEYRDSVYRVANTRVTLDSLVYAYWEGHSPETIALESKYAYRHPG